VSWRSCPKGGKHDWFKVTEFIYHGKKYVQERCSRCGAGRERKL
jgi:hypothetical protein